MTEPSWGYLRLIAKAGPCGVGVPCRYVAVNSGLMQVTIDFAVPPKHGPEVVWKIVRRTGHDERHTLALFSSDSRRMILVTNPGFHCAGREANFGYIWKHRDPDGWWCTPGWPDAARIRDDVEVYA